MKKCEICFIVLLNLIYMIPAAAMTTSDSTALISPPSVNTQVQCTRLRINDVDATASGVTSSMAIDNSNCTGGSGFYLVLSAPGFGAGGGQLGYQCPASHPFLMSYTENWGMVLGAVGASSNATRCCLTPPMKVASKTNWEPSPDAWRALYWWFPNIGNLACSLI
jgi:hypothetical protein